MSEPTYEYVKGQGWVVSNTPRSATGYLTTGERFHFEFRMPLPGEYYDAVGKNNPRFFIDGFPLWDKWLVGYNLLGRPHLCVWEEGQKAFATDEYVTLVIDD